MSSILKSGKSTQIFHSAQLIICLTTVGVRKIFRQFPAARELTAFEEFCKKIAKKNCKKMAKSAQTAATFGRPSLE